MNTDQSSQFTSQAFTGLLKEHDIKISMDGKGSWRDNVFIERLWRTVKYDNIYVREYQTVSDTRSGLREYFGLYNTERIHQSLGYQTPWEIHSGLSGQAGKIIEAGVYQDMAALEKTPYNANMSKCYDGKP